MKNPGRPGWMNNRTYMTSEAWTPESRAHKDQYRATYLIDNPERRFSPDVRSRRSRAAIEKNLLSHQPTTEEIAVVWHVVDRHIRLEKKCVLAKPTRKEVLEAWGKIKNTSWHHVGLYARDLYHYSLMEAVLRSLSIRPNSPIHMPLHRDEDSMPYNLDRQFTVLNQYNTSSKN